MDEYKLFRHVTTGGAVYLTDGHSFKDAKIVIRLDGGAELVRCNVDMDIIDNICGACGQEQTPNCNNANCTYRG